MELARALELSYGIKHILEPACIRIEVAGSVRRGRAQVADIEIVCIPKRSAVDLFDESTEVANEFCRLVESLGPAEKGNPRGKYTRRKLPEGIDLDLFMATPQNWGVIYAIRTGSAEYAHKILAAGWVRKGYKSIGGILHQLNGPRVEVKEEEDLYNLIGLEWAEPNSREYGKGRK